MTVTEDVRETRIVFLGPPGAGKGTQAKLLASRRAVAHISTGDLLREAVQAGTELGRRADGFMRDGNLVPDDVINGLVVERLASSDCEAGWLLDGFPRTRVQAEALETALEQIGSEVDVCICFEVPADSIVARLSGRLICRDCGQIFHRAFNPPKTDGRCDHCSGNDLYQRDDDHEDSVRRRLDDYKNLTSELIVFYEERGKLGRVDGEGAVEEVSARVEASLGRS